MNNLKHYFLFAMLLICSRVMAQIPGGAISTYTFCGNANDVTGTNNGQTVGVSLTNDRFGNPNSAYYFNGGPNSYINLGTSNTLKMGEGSISVWARPDTFSNAGSGYLLNPIVLTKNQPGSNCYEGYAIGLAFSAGVPQFHATITQPQCNQVNAIYGTVNYQNWYHIVFAWNNSFTWLYVNGALITTMTKNFSSTYLASDSVMIGNSANSQNNRFFLGAIDDLIFYSKPLSLQDVQMLYADTSLICTPAGISSEILNTQMSLIPNPAYDQFVVNGLQADQLYTATIYDGTGHLVRSEVISAEAPSMSVADLPEAMYIVVIDGENFKCRSRLIVSR